MATGVWNVDSKVGALLFECSYGNGSTYIRDDSLFEAREILKQLMHQEKLDLNLLLHIPWTTMKIIWRQRLI